MYILVITYLRYFNFWISLYSNILWSEETEYYNMNIFNCKFNQKRRLYLEMLQKFARMYFHTHSYHAQNNWINQFSFSEMHTLLFYLKQVKIFWKRSIKILILRIWFDISWFKNCVNLENSFSWSLFLILIPVSICNLVILNIFWGRTKYFTKIKEISGAF